jgi:cobalt-precorrin 5A hydrolase / precorrin-3B C17-methyltransferase
VIGLIAVTGSGRTAAARLAASWPGQTRTYDGPTRQALTRAWAQCDGLVCFLAVGATVRLIAPLLDSKWTDPAVVSLDESARHAVAVVGGHAAGANALAARVAEVFGAVPVITTATDAVSLPGLDMLGWPTEGAIGTVSRALLDGEHVRLESDRIWPLPALPDSVGDVGDCSILITDRVTTRGPRTAVLRPPSLVVGVGMTGEAASHEVLRLVDGALAEAGLCAASVTAVAMATASGLEPASEIHGAGSGEQVQEVRAAARERGWPLLTYPLSWPAAGARPGSAPGATRSTSGATPSTNTATATPGSAASERANSGSAASGSANNGSAASGSANGRSAHGATGSTAHGATDSTEPSAPVSTAWSVPGAAAEAAALAGSAAELVLGARTAGTASVAIARLRPRGRLALVGTGPGARDLLTPRAVYELRRASVLLGLGRALEHVADLIRTGTEVLRSEPGEELVSIRQAVAEARQGRAVAVALPAEPGMDVLASLARDLAKDDIDVIEVPGVAG